MLQNEDEKYLHIREKLRSLPQVKASDNFMMSLQYKINLIDAESHNLSSTIHKETHERINRGVFARFFGVQQRPWLIPSLSFTVVIFLVLTIVYFGYFNTSGTNDTQQTLSGNTQTNDQKEGGTGLTNNNSGNNNQQSGNTNSSSSNAEPRIGNTDSQPGNDEGLLATNDDRLGKTDSYNNRRVNTTAKLPVTNDADEESGEQLGNMLSSFNSETTNANSPSSYEENVGLRRATNVGVAKDEGGVTKSAMKPFDEKSGVSVDEKKKNSSKNPRNIREVSNIGKTGLQDLIDALNDE